MNTKPTNIAELIALVESNNNQYAMRYEPMYSVQSGAVSVYAKDNNVSLATAHICLCSSWGLYQIMGANLFAYGLTSNMLQYCNSIPLQNMYFQKFLTKNNLNNLTSDYQSFVSDDSKLAEFARVYNGPSNIDDYVNRMKEFV